MSARVHLAGWRPGARTWVLGGLLVALLATVATLGVTTLAWGDTLREEQRLLPGTSVATVEVGDLTIDEAVAAVEEHLGPRLDDTIEVTHADRRWETTPRDLGATTDVEDVVAAAFARTDAAGLTDLARVRWTGGISGLDFDVAVEVGDDGIAGFVGGLAEELDREPVDARIDWADGAFEVSEAETGREVEQADARDALLDAVLEETGDVELPVATLEPAVPTETARAAVDTVGPVVEEALDRTITLALDDETWSTTPRELSATPDLGPVRDAAERDAPDELGDGVPLEIHDETVSGYLDTIAGEVYRPARDADARWTGDTMDVVPHRTGRSLARDQAGADLREALREGGDHVELSASTVQPAVTTSSFDRVLFLRQSDRRLALIESGEVVADWPVAVGQGGSPTPTGTYTVGAKRFEPTWVNPSPDGWGSDMPERIGPGPDNPLGLRALNWNRNGVDTLIRFHGTPNEDSIGEAASQGCVRMFNDDVIELFDLVSSGTTIISRN